MILEEVLGQLIGNRHIQTVDEESDSKGVRHFLGYLGKSRDCFFVRTCANSMLGHCWDFWTCANSMLGQCWVLYIIYEACIMI